MEVKVLFFGVLTEVTGTNFKHYRDVQSINHLKQRIQDEFPEIVHYNYLLSINSEITDSDHLLKSGDEVALLPPFAGGWIVHDFDIASFHIDKIMNANYLTVGPISPKIISGLIEKMAEKTDSGGHMIFLGQVRADITGGKSVKAIEYSAYEDMVNTEAEKIKMAILSEFDDVKSVDIIHSTGVVGAGEISLVIFVSAGHRQQAIQACSRTLEMVKDRLPVWKKEIFDDNSRKWK